MGKKEDLSIHETLEQTQRSGHVPCPQSFPTSWHSAGLGINRRACCAPRMHVCRVPISEYTVIGLPEGPYLTFRLQVAGHSIAHPSSASAINPFLAHFSRHKQKQIKSQEDYVIWLKGPKQKMDFVLRLFCQLLFQISKMKSEAQLSSSIYSTRPYGQCHSDTIITDLTQPNYQTGCETSQWLLVKWLLASKMSFLSQIFENRFLFCVLQME